MAREKGIKEGAVEVAERIQEEGIIPGDSILKNADLVCAAGHCSEPVENGNSITFKCLVSHTITFNREVEVTIDGQDNVSYENI